MSIAAYVRVSSKWQKDVSQRAEIEKWLDANGIVQVQVQWLVSPLGSHSRMRWRSSGWQGLY
jgi:DNA invertase Pin-like site-specific DNA recombinase